MAVIAENHVIHSVMSCCQQFKSLEWNLLNRSIPSLNVSLRTVETERNSSGDLKSLFFVGITLQLISVLTGYIDVSR